MLIIIYIIIYIIIKPLSSPFPIPYARMQECKIARFLGKTKFLIFLIFKQLRKTQCYLIFSKFINSVSMTLQIRIKTLIPKHAKAEKLCLSAQK